MTEFGTAEGLCRMTGFTTQLARQVLLRLHHIVSSQTQPAGMTGRAVARSAPQYAARVARLTTYGGVSAGQGESCLQMIEASGLALRLQANSKGQEKGTRKDLNHAHIQALYVKLHAKTPLAPVQRLPD